MACLLFVTPALPFRLPCGDACLDPDAVSKLNVPTRNGTVGETVDETVDETADETAGTTGAAKGTNARGINHDHDHADRGGETASVGEREINGDGVLREGGQGGDGSGRGEAGLPRGKGKGKWKAGVQRLDLHSGKGAGAASGEGPGDGGGGGGGDGDGVGGSGDGGGHGGGHDDGLGDGVIDQGSGERKVEYFPVNAAALRQSVEDSADKSICSHRHLPPLVDLVAPGEDGRAGFVVRWKRGTVHAG